MRKMVVFVLLFGGLSTAAIMGAFGRHGGRARPGSGSDQAAAEQEQREDRPRGPRASAAGTPVPPGGGVPRLAASTKQRIEDAMTTRVAGLRGKPDVEAYLAELEGTARRKGRVTVVELFPGRAAIERLRGSLEHEAVELRLREFDAHMTTIAHELNAPERNTIP